MRRGPRFKWLCHRSFLQGLFRGQDSGRWPRRHRSEGKSANSTTSCTARPLRLNSISSRILSGFDAAAALRCNVRLCVMAPPCPASDAPDGGDTDISRCGGTANLHAKGSSVCEPPPPDTHSQSSAVIRSYSLQSGAWRFPILQRKEGAWCWNRRWCWNIRRCARIGHGTACICRGQVESGGALWPLEILTSCTCIVCSSHPQGQA